MASLTAKISRISLATPSTVAEKLEKELDAVIRDIETHLGIRI